MVKLPVPPPEALFAAVLRPNRSAGTRAVNVTVALLAGVFFLTGLGFALVGAWPIFGFLGLDIALLYFALRWNLRAADAFESVAVTADALTIVRVDHWGTRTTETFQPYWAQVALNEGSTRLEIRSHGRGMIVGGFLAPDERVRLAEALRGALARGRSAAPEAPGR